MHAFEKPQKTLGANNTEACVVCGPELVNEKIEAQCKCSCIFLVFVLVIILASMSPMMLFNS